MDQAPRPWVVMVVDDDALIRRAISIYLTTRSYEVIEAVNAADCLTKLCKKIPDIILLDVMMPPGPDGRETCQRIREFSEVPIILLTARAQETDRDARYCRRREWLYHETDKPQGSGGESSRPLAIPGPRMTPPTPRQHLALSPAPQQLSEIQECSSLRPAPRPAARS